MVVLFTQRTTLAKFNAWTLLAAKVINYAVHHLFKAMATNLSSLSPAAQALKVKDAAYALPIGTGLSSRIAAALEAAADQVVPDEEHPGPSQFWDDEAEQEWQNNRHVRLQFLAIAAELEGL